MDKVLVGVAGEYYIAFHLSARGYHVGLTAPGARGADLLVSNLDTRKSITIQVKTMKEAFVPSKKWGPYWKWRVGTNRGAPHKTFYYVFVDLRDNLSKAPHVFIVPSLSLQPLLEEYSKSGAAVRDVWCIISEKDKGQYLNRWDIIEGALTLPAHATHVGA